MDPSKRPTTTQLLGLPFIRACLTGSNDSYPVGFLASRFSRRSSNGSARYSSDGTSAPVSVEIHTEVHEECAAGSQALRAPPYFGPSEGSKAETSAQLSAQCPRPPVYPPPVAPAGSFRDQRSLNRGDSMPCSNEVLKKLPSDRPPAEGSYKPSSSGELLLKLPSLHLQRHVLLSAEITSISGPLESIPANNSVTPAGHRRLLDMTSSELSSSQRASGSSGLLSSGRGAAGLEPPPRHSLSDWGGPSGVQQSQVQKGRSLSSSGTAAPPSPPAFSSPLTRRPARERLVYVPVMVGEAPPSAVVMATAPKLLTSASEPLYRLPSSRFASSPGSCLPVQASGRAASTSLEGAGIMRTRALCTSMPSITRSSPLAANVALPAKPGSLHAECQAMLRGEL